MIKDKAHIAHSLAKVFQFILKLKLCTLKQPLCRWKFFSNQNLENFSFRIDLLNRVSVSAREKVREKEKVTDRHRERVRECVCVCVCVCVCLRERDGKSLVKRGTIFIESKKVKWEGRVNDITLTTFLLGTNRRF